MDLRTIYDLELTPKGEYLREKIKDVHDFKEIKYGVHVHVVHLTKLNLIIKRMRFKTDLPLDSEYRIGSIVNTYNLNYMMTTLGYFKWKFHDHFYHCVIFQKHSGVMFTCIFHDILNGTRMFPGYKLKDINVLILKIIRDYQYRYKFTHYDLNTGNILVNLKDTRYHLFDYDGNLRCILSPYKIKIIDFGRSHVTGYNNFYQFPGIYKHTSTIYDPIIDYTTYLGGIIQYLGASNLRELFKKNNLYHEDGKNHVGYIIFDNFSYSQTSNLDDDAIYYHTNETTTLSVLEVHRKYTEELISLYNSKYPEDKQVLNENDILEQSREVRSKLREPDEDQFIKIYDKYMIELGRSITAFSLNRIKNYKNHPEDFFEQGIHVNFTI